MNSLEHKKLIRATVMAILSMSAAAHGATFFASDGADGNVIVNVDGGHTFVLDGHPVTPGPYFANIDSVITLTGDSAAPLEITNGSYRVENYGQLIGMGTENAVDVFTNSFMGNSRFTNRGEIHSALNTIGFNASGHSISLINEGDIIGSGTLSAGAVVLGDGSSVVNDSTNGPVEAIIQATGTAVLGEVFLSVINSGGGSRIVSQQGVAVDVIGRLHLSNGAEIVGNIGIAAGHNAVIQNFAGGEIHGDERGINVLNDGFIRNEGSISVSGGLAPLYAILAGEDFELINSGDIESRGATSSTIVATSGADIENLENGYIFGEAEGAITISSGFISNSGQIESLGGRAIQAIGLSPVSILNTSTGTIISDGNAIDTGNQDVAIASNGLIEGRNGVAIDLGSGNDRVAIGSGGVVRGDIVAATGEDELILGASIDSTHIYGLVEDFEHAQKNGSNLSVIHEGLESDNLDVNLGRLSLVGGLFGATSTTVGDNDTSTTFLAELGGVGDFHSDTTVVNGSGGISPGERSLVDSIDPLEVIGNIRFHGDLTFERGSIYRVDVIPEQNAFVPASFDSIRMGGDLTIDNALLSVAPLRVGRPIQDQAVEVIGAGNPAHMVDGNFSLAYIWLTQEVVDSENAGSVYDVTKTGLHIPVTFSLESVVVENDILLSVEHDYSAVPGLSEGGVAFGAYLNTLLDDSLGNPELADFLAFLDYSDGDVVAGVMNSADPAAHGSLQNQALHSSNRIFNAVRNQRLARRRGVVAVAGAMYDDKGVVIPAAPQVMSRDWNVWGSAAFDLVEQDHAGVLAGAPDLSDMDGDRSSIIVGMERSLSDKLTVGAAAMYTQNDVDGVIDADIDSELFALYANYGSRLGWQGAALVGYGNHDFDTSREALLQTSETSYSGDGLLAMLSSSYMMEKNGFRWGPTAGVEYREMTVDSFEESGVLGLSVHERNIDSLRLLAGVEASKNFQQVRWNSSVRWAYDLNATSQDSITASFAGMPGSFSVDAPERSEHSLFLSTGIYKDLNERSSVGVSYFGEVPIGGDGLSSHGGSIEVKYSF